MGEAPSSDILTVGMQRAKQQSFRSGGVALKRKKTPRQYLTSAVSFKFIVLA